MLSRACRQPRLGGFFDVAGRCARVAVRGGRDPRLVTARATARGGPLGSTTADTGGSGIFELLAHAIKLSRVIRTESAALFGRTLTMASTTTTHRPIMIASRLECPRQEGLAAAVLQPISCPAVADVVRRCGACSRWRGAVGGAGEPVGGGPVRAWQRPAATGRSCCSRRGTARGNRRPWG
jgi:hypothetical protein